MGKVQKVVRFKIPQSGTEIKSFLDMASFFRRFVPNFSLYATPMFELLKKNKGFVWDEQCEQGFNDIKEMLEKPTLLAHPKFDLPFIIQCDASGSAIGFMLAQDQIKPITFGGRVLSETEGRYAVTG